jgi:hypothetical protein
MSELTNAQRAALLAASGGTVGNLAVAQFCEQTEVTVTTGGETLIEEWVVNLDQVGGGVAGANIEASVDLDYSSARLSGADFGNFNLRVGGTTPGTIGGTVRATVIEGFSTTSRRLAGATGSGFANPGGRVLVQLTADVANTSQITVNVFSSHIKVGLA